MKSQIKRTTMRWLVLLGILAITAAAACNGTVSVSFNTPTPQAAPPSEAPTAIPTARVEPTQAPTQPARIASQISADIANFRHQDLNAAVGVTVTWTNKDSVPHTVTAGEPGAESGAFDSGIINQNGSFSFTFEREGSFPYFCKIHTSMRGTVTVTLAGGVDTGESSERMEAATAEAERQMAEATAQTERRIANATAEAEKRMMEATVEAEKMEKETATTGPQVAAEIKSSTLPNLVVEVGTTVTWTNADPIPHTASAGTPVEPTRFFESLSLNSGANYSFTFTEGGEYPYFCRVHPRTMQAVVKVVAAEEKARMEREATPTPVPEPTPRTEPTATPTPVPNAEISRDDGSAATPTPISTGRVSEIRNFTLENITIPVGTTVTWTNRDSVPHTSSAVGRVWESDALFEGQSFSFKFTQVGQFEYFCQFHPMRATVTVTGG